MNNLHNNIASTYMTGASRSSSNASRGKDVQGLSGFMSHIPQNLDGSSGKKNDLKKTQTTDAPHKELTAKIAAMLKKYDTQAVAETNKTPDDLAAMIAGALQQSNMLPESLKSLSPEELTAKVSALLQQSGIVPDPDSIKPVLTSDLTAPLSSQLQAQDSLSGKVADMLENNQDSPSTDLAETLNNIAPGSAENSPHGDLTKILTQLQKQIEAQQQDPASTLTPAALQQLNDKITQLLQSGDQIGINDIAKLKVDIIQALKDQGFAPSDIKDYLASLAQPLRDDAGETRKLTGQENAATSILHLLQPAAGKEKAQSVQTATTGPKALVPTDEEHNKAPATAPKQETAPEQTNNTSPRPQAAAPAQPQPVLQQTLSAKIAGFSINPALISALAGSGGGFNADSSGTGTGSMPQDMINNIALLKPVSVDTINAQSFTNYLTAARSGTPTALTQMVNIQLQRNINAKIGTMTIQLDPMDLGTLDIKLKFKKDGAIRAHLVVEKPETLALLQKDSHHLEKILQQSGLDIDEKSLSFDLRHQNSQQNLEGFNGEHKDDNDEFNGHINGLVAENAIYAQMAIQAPGYITRSGVNIMV